MSLRSPAAGGKESPRRYPLFMAPVPSTSFTRQRALYLLTVPTLLLAVCLHFRQPVLGFCLSALAVWPFPFRCRVGPDGIRISWLFVHEQVVWSDIRKVELHEDSRRRVIGWRGVVLTIERVDGSKMVLRGSREVLKSTVSEVAAFARRDRARGEPLLVVVAA